MDKLINEYISLLLKAVKASEKHYLYIEMPLFLKEYEEVFRDCAKEYDLREIYFQYDDVFKKHELLSYLDQENIYKHPLFDNSIKNKYAKLDAAFIFIMSSVPGLMADIPVDKIKNTRIHTRKTEHDFRALYENNKLNWLIASIPNKYWSDALKMSLNDLWELIFKCSLVDGDGTSHEKWLNKLDLAEARASKLTKYQFEYLHYESSNGTDLKVYLPKNHIWACGKNVTGCIVNLPTEEIFNSPQYDKTEGIVYSSKPLLYNNSLIEDFWIKFKDGKAIEYDAKVGKELLESIITNDEYSCYLGECALVSYDSPISNTNVVFQETLFDENASCHLALGTGFGECVQGGIEAQDDELRKLGVNVSKTHVDFMIGTKDMKITGVTKNGEEIPVMIDGNIC